jgi:hypothetical protein
MFVLLRTMNENKCGSASLYVQSSVRVCSFAVQPPCICTHFRAGVLIQQQQQTQQQQQQQQQQQ